MVFWGFLFFGHFFFIILRILEIISQFFSSFFGIFGGLFVSLSGFLSRFVLNYFVSLWNFLRFFAKFLNIFREFFEDFIQIIWDLSYLIFLDFRKKLLEIFWNYFLYFCPFCNFLKKKVVNYLKNFWELEEISLAISRIFCGYFRIIFSEMLCFLYIYWIFFNFSLIFENFSLNILIKFLDFSNIFEKFFRIDCDLFRFFQDFLDIYSKKFSIMFEYNMWFFSQKLWEIFWDSMRIFSFLLQLYWIFYTTFLRIFL